MTTLNSSLPPPVAEYGVDEISALILDPGYSAIRAGFAGEDTPKSVVPTYYGCLSSGDETPSYVFDDNAIHNPLPNLDIRNPMALDSIVEDWDVAAKLFEYTISSRLTGRKQTSPSRNGLNIGPKGEDVDVEMENVETMERPLTDYPLLMTEPGWNPSKNREKSIEIAMEDWDCPAFWLGRSGVLAAFASGKPSALVVDIGASTTSITPVHDGMILKRGTVKSPLAGNWISSQLRIMFSKMQPPVPLTPHYLVTSKTPVDAGAPAQAVYRSFTNPPRDSFRRLQEERVLDEFKESCVQVWLPHRVNGASLADSAAGIKANEAGRPFEMPDGWNNVFGVERYRAVEGMFNETAAMNDAENPSPNKSHTIPGLAKTSLESIDTDIKSHLLSQVVVTGGTSLIQSMTERINWELQSLYPGPRVRLQAPGNLLERKFASWIGGSILASLGAFHQMWISKAEYEEHGKGIVEKRCR